MSAFILHLQAGARAMVIVPFDGGDHEPEKCVACCGLGGERECDEDGYSIHHNCKPCMGTGDRVWCWACAQYSDACRDDQRAVREVRVFVDEHTFVSRLICKRDECLGECTSAALEVAERKANQRATDARERLEAERQYAASVCQHNDVPFACEICAGERSGLLRDMTRCGRAACNRALDPRSRICLDRGKAFCTSACAVMHREVARG